MYEARTRAQILASLPHRRREAWDGQLVIARDSIHWLAAPPEATLPTATTFEWVAAKPYPESRGDFPFLPRELQHGGVLRLHFAESVGVFVDLGPARVFRYGVSRSEPYGELAAELEQKLPKDVWLRLGGYDGWSVAYDDGERAGLAPDDAVAAVAEAIAHGARQIDVTRYENDVLSLLVERDRAFVMYLESPGDDGAYACAPDAAGDRTPVAFTLTNGQVDEFPREYTVPHAAGLAAVEHLVRHDALTPTLTWTRDLDL